MRGGMVALASMVLVAGCATYRPAPLPTPTVVLGAAFPPSALDLAAPLTDLDAARVALATSPDLAATNALAGVADAQLVAAGLLPDPQIALSADRPVPAGLVDALSAALSLDLGFLATRGPRAKEASANRERVHLDVAWTEWLAINHVRLLVRRIQSLDQQMEVAVDAELAASALYDDFRASMQRGDARLDDVAVHQVGLLDARDRRLALGRQRAAARQELNATLGAPPATKLNLAAMRPLQPLDALDASSLGYQAADRRLDLAALRAGYEAQEQSLKTATRLALPLPQIGISHARDTSAIHTNGISLGTTLPLWNRNRGGIAVATATRTQLAAEYRARLLQARGDIGAAVADLRSIDAERRAIAAQLPALSASAETLSRAAREGNVTAITYESVRAALLDKRLALLMLQQAQSEGEVALETAVGAFVWKW